MLFGTITAICHGAALPALMLIFGDLIDTYTNQAISRSFWESLEGMGDCGGECVTNCMEIIMNIVGVNGTVPNCTNPNSTFERALEMCFSSQVECLDQDAFLDAVNLQVLTFFGIGVGVFICGTLQIYLYQTACERQVKKIRVKFYRAVLRQNIGWFDANPSGELASRLTE